MQLILQLAAWDDFFYIPLYGVGLRGASHGQVLLGHKPGSDQPRLGHIREGVWCWRTRNIRWPQEHHWGCVPAHLMMYLTTIQKKRVPTYLIHKSERILIYLQDMFSLKTHLVSNRSEKDFLSFTFMCEYHGMLTRFLSFF